MGVRDRLRVGEGVGVVRGDVIVAVVVDWGWAGSRRSEKVVDLCIARCLATVLVVREELAAPFLKGL